MYLEHPFDSVGQGVVHPNLLGDEFFYRLVEGRSSRLISG